MVYVDDAIFAFMGKNYCHMVAETHDELMAMAAKIKLNPDWIQKADTWQEHFDLSPSRRLAAIKHGAKAVNWREMAAIWRAKNDGTGN